MPAANSELLPLSRDSSLIASYSSWRKTETWGNVLLYSCYIYTTACFAGKCLRYSAVLLRIFFKFLLQFHLVLTLSHAGKPFEKHVSQHRRTYQWAVVICCLVVFVTKNKIKATVLLISMKPACVTHQFYWILFPPKRGRRFQFCLQGWPTGRGATILLLQLQWVMFHPL